MARDSYTEALRRILVHEGGYTNHPADKGGPTNFGITIKDYRMYVDRAGTATDVKNMSVETAKKIYKEKYWAAMRCDELPAGLDYAVFDYGVNSGLGRAGKVLRRLCGLSDTTHVVTQELIDAVNRRDTRLMIDALCAERMYYLKSLKSLWPVFGRGWERRVREVAIAAKAMHAGGAAAKPLGPVAGKPEEGAFAAVKKPVVGALAAASASGAAVWQWAVENPFLAALIVQVSIAVVLAIVWFWTNSKKPKPVPETFDAIPMTEPVPIEDEPPVPPAILPEEDPRPEPEPVPEAEEDEAPRPKKRAKS